jgi:hypothetical protein
LQVRLFLEHEAGRTSIGPANQKADASEALAQLKILSDESWQRSRYE